jgi:hypothetical protein
VRIQHYIFNAEKKRYSDFKSQNGMYQDYLLEGVIGRDLKAINFSFKA